MVIKIITNINIYNIYNPIGHKVTTCLTYTFIYRIHQHIYNNDDAGVDC